MGKGGNGGGGSVCRSPYYHTCSPPSSTASLRLAIWPHNHSFNPGNPSRMLKVQVSSPSPDTNPQHARSLADLSRNASVISSSSSSSSTSDLTVQSPQPPRPIRTFSSPRRHPRSRSPQSPSTPRGSRPPAYLARELGISEDKEDRHTELRAPRSRPHSRSRNSSVNGRLSASDFEFGRVLGEGSYSTVIQARNLNTGNEYAIKVLDKGHLKRKDKTETALAEKNTLVRLGSGHPGIVRLHSTFQDEWSLFFVLDLARNGELQSRISRMGSLSLTCSRYYSAQLVDALDYMHQKGVIHRDLKPENLLLDDKFRIKITDFGTGKILGPGADRAKTFVGTAQYVAPELLENSETSKSSDLWATGCILFQMIAGKFAFQGLSEYLTWEKIKRLDYSFPEGFDEEAKDLVQKLLVRDPTQRLGAGELGSSNDMKALRSHPFFSTVNWATLWTDPAPPLQAGLFKKEQPPPGPGRTSLGNWEDVGATWDEMVEGEEEEEEEEGDGISWASDGEGRFQFAAGQRSGGPLAITTNDYSHADEVGPMGETRPYAFPSATTPPTQASSKDIPPHVNGSASQVPPQTQQPPQNGTSGVVRFGGVTNGDAEAEMEEDRDKVPPNMDALPESVRTQPIDVPFREKRDSLSTGSATSSSDGSPVEKLGVALEAAGLNRGRNRAQTPIQGNSGPDEEWSNIVGPEENVIFNSAVETSALRRRASRLLAMAVAPRRKIRELILTDRRLVCLKRKPGRPYCIRNDFVLRQPEKEKDSRFHITGVEMKGDREFVVMTSAKSHCFITANPTLATTWVRYIREALESQGTRQ